MEPTHWTSKDLASRIRKRGLRRAVARIAVEGGEEVHPALAFTAEDIDLDPEGFAMSMIRDSGRDDLVPLWQTNGTTVVYSTGDGRFQQWDAELDEPSEDWPDFTAAVRYLLTDLWEGQHTDEELAEIAALLLPRRHREAALRLEER